MRMKQVLALVVTVIGIGVLGAGFYYKKRINETKEGISTMMAPLSGNPFSSVITVDAKNKLKSYELKIHLFLGFGALLTAFGISYYIYSKKHDNSFFN
jgi:uncharacterized membrane-anchored protein